jgi:hypothetical protein
MVVMVGLPKTAKEAMEGLSCTGSNDVTSWGLEPSTHGGRNVNKLSTYCRANLGTRFSLFHFRLGSHSSECIALEVVDSDRQLGVERVVQHRTIDGKHLLDGREGRLRTNTHDGSNGVKKGLYAVRNETTGAELTRRIVVDVGDGFATSLERRELVDQQVVKPVDFNKFR